MVLIASSGIGFYGHSVLLDPLRNQHGWSKGVVSSAISLYFVVSAIVGMTISRSIDAKGPRNLLFFGALIFGFALMLLGFVDEIWQLFAVYVILAAGWSATSSTPFRTPVSTWPAGMAATCSAARRHRASTTTSCRWATGATPGRWCF